MPVAGLLLLADGAAAAELAGTGVVMSCLP
jgi:hypothetical protein